MIIARRELVIGALAASLAPRFGFAALPEREQLWFVNPELRPAAKQMANFAKEFPQLSDAALPAMRGPAPWAKPPLVGIPYRKELIPGPPGAPALALYVINARQGARRPAILHTHGGGYVLGKAVDGIHDLQQIAAALDCAIVTVDYRLAPETRASGSIDDNYAGLRWLHAHATELGVDPARLAVMGESAGGGHAALLAITARDRGEVPIVFQCLIYPMLDDRTGSTHQVAPNIGTLVWNAASNRYGWRSFLGHEPGRAVAEPTGVPARVADLSGLPPAFIGVGAIDLFVEEDIEYARRLIVAGVPTELNVVPGAFHGFDGIAADTRIAKAFNTAKLDALRRAFAA